MRMLATLSLAAVTLTLGACATNQPGSLVESGYTRGSLAVAAIDRGDWATAEQLLANPAPSMRDDPARLINLGRVYMAQGRTGEAMSAWRLALAADGHVEVVTKDGRMVKTDQLAREALAFHDRGTRSAAR